MIAYLCEYTKTHLIMHFKCVHCMVCELVSINLLFFKKGGFTEILDCLDLLGIPNKNKEINI